MPEQHKPGREQAARQPSIPMLWVVGAVVIFLASWLGPNLSSLHRGDGLFSMSPFFHYSLSVGVWFLAFSGGYLLIERLELPFGRAASYTHFGLLALGTMLIIAPSVALGWFPDPVANDDIVALFRLLNGIAMLGYGLTLLALAVFLCALGRCVLARLISGRR